MDTLGVGLFFLAIAILMALFNYQMWWSWPVARPRIEATWPRHPGNIEGFISGDGYDISAKLKSWLPAPETLTRPAGNDCPTVLDNAQTYESGLGGKPYKAYDLLDDWFQGKPPPRVANGPTSANCYKTDYSRTLEPGGSFAQVTNNYQHGYPDSCSAPNHDLVLDFYEPKPTFVDGYTNLKA